MKTKRIPAFSNSSSLIHSGFDELGFRVGLVWTVSLLAEALFPGVRKEPLLAGKWMVGLAVEIKLRRSYVSRFRLG